MLSAHTRCAAGSFGAQVKIARRLGESEMPRIFVGPVTSTSMMYVGSVVPAAPVPPEARDHSCGLMRSSYGPSAFFTNDTDSVFCPPVMVSGSV